MLSKLVIENIVNICCDMNAIKLKIWIIVALIISLNHEMLIKDPSDQSNYTFLILELEAAFICIHNLKVKQKILISNWSIIAFIYSLIGSMIKKFKTTASDIKANNIVIKYYVMMFHASKLLGPELLTFFYIHWKRLIKLIRKILTGFKLKGEMEYF